MRIALVVGLWLAATPSGWAQRLPPALPPPPAPRTQASPTAVTVDWQGGLQLALANSPRLGASLSQIRESFHEAESAAAPGRLQGKAGLFVEYRGEPASPPHEVSVNGGSQYFQDQGYSYARIGDGFELRQLLFDGGRIEHRLKQLRASQHVAEQKAVIEWHLICMEVRLAMLEVLEAQRACEALLGALEGAQENLRAAESRYRLGFVARGDVLTAQVAVSDNELLLVKERRRLHAGKEELCALLGLDQATALSVAEPPPVRPLTGDLAACLEQGRRERPELRAATHAVEACQAAIRLARADANPILEARAAYVGVGFLHGSGLPSGYQIGLELSWPFLDGGRRSHLAQQAEAKLVTLQLQAKEIDSKIEKEIRLAYGQVEVARQAVEAGRTRVDQQEEVLRIARARYRTGLGNFPLLRDAQTQRDQSDNLLWKHYYDYLRTRLHLARAVADDPGPPLKLPPGPPTSPKKPHPGDGG